VEARRRLAACRDLLQLVSIDATVVDLKSVVQGEYAENELRKDFTPSERLAIAEAVESELGERRGNGNLKNSSGFKGALTRDIAAEKSGLGSFATLNQVKTVVETAEPEVVEAMDKGEISINKAREISKLPPDTQKDLDAAKAEVSRLKAEAKDAKEEIRKKQTQANIIERQNEHLRQQQKRLKGEKDRLLNETYEATELLNAAEEMMRQQAIFMVALEGIEDFEDHPEKVRETVTTLADQSDKLSQVLRSLYNERLVVIEGGAS
jgi:septal ring factor EnvC (AmiA/AmiB activator)